MCWWTVALDPRLEPQRLPGPSPVPPVGWKRTRRSLPRDHLPDFLSVDRREAYVVYNIRTGLVDRPNIC
jgi:hypothetical protein